MIKKIELFLIQNKKIFLFSIVHWIITFFSDKLYFHYSLSNGISINNLIVYCFLKITFLVLLFIIWYYIFYFFKKKLYFKESFRLFVLYFVIMMIFLLLTWPGIWRNDDLGILLYAQTFRFESWHHFLTSVYYIYSLMLFPFPTGVIIIQCLIICLIVSYVIDNLIKLLFVNLGKRLSFALSLLLLIPFVFPSVIDNNLYPMRLIIYGYIELLLFFLVLKIFIEKRKINLPFLIVFCILCVLVITWRSEGIYLIIFMPLFLFIYYKINVISIKKMLLCALFIVISSFAINYVNSYLLVKNYSNTYKVTLAYGSIKDLIFNSTEEDKLYLDNIDRVLNVSYIKDNPTIWLGTAKRSNISESDMKAYFNSYYNLIINHFDVFFKNRIVYFNNTNALSKDINTTIWNSARLFDYKPTDGHYYALNLLKKTNGLFSYPINKQLRTNVIEFLEGRDSETYKTNIIFTLFWNSIPALISLIIMLIYSLVKRKFFVSLTLCAILVKPILVFIAAPDPYFMYYFPEFIIGYVSLFVFLCYLILKLIKKNNYNNYIRKFV